MRVAAAPLRGCRARSRPRPASRIPAFDEFWAGRHRRGQGREPRAGDAGGLPRRSRRTSAQDAVGQDRDLLREDRLVRLRRLPAAMRPGWSRPNGWARRRPSAIRCTCCRTSRPTSCTASSTTARIRAPTKIKGRQPITMHPADAAARGIADGDLVRVFNDRGACLAAARLSDRIRPRRGAAVDRRLVRSGRCRAPTGRWRSTAIPTR